MNQQQANLTVENAKKIESVNFEEIISRIYPDNSDLENIQLTNMSLSEFVNSTKRVMYQFINQFQNRDITLPLPYMHIHPQFGNAQVDAQILNFFNHLNEPNLNTAEQLLLWLIDYQLNYNFYDRSNEVTKDITLKNISQISDKLKLLQDGLDNKKTEVYTFFDELSKSKKEIDALILQKREELAQITANLATANTQSTQITEVVTKGVDQGSRLNAILDQQEQNKVNSDKKLLELQELYAATNTKLSDHVNTVLSQIGDFKKQVESNQANLEFVESKKAFFEERITYLEALIGREVGASLFETFKQRKVELNESLKFWRAAVPVMAVLTVLWVFFLFKNQVTGADMNLWWEAFALNTLKSIPAIFLLIFSITQYGKERTFQEEYAFKSAVALTIDAYASRIQDPKSKDTLIMEAVLNIYRTPIEEKQSGKIKSKKTLDIIKTATDTISNLTKSGK